MTNASTSGHAGDGLESHRDAASTAGSDPVEIVVDVVILGELESVRWRPAGVQAPPEILTRLARTGVDLDDPVGFLLAMRSAFGEDLEISVTTPN